MTDGACSPLTPLSQLSVFLFARFAFWARVTRLSPCLLLYLCSSLVLPPITCITLPRSHLPPDPRRSLSLSLFLPSRKSLSTICLAVMNSEPFRTNQLGQINESLQGDKLSASVRESVCVCARLKCFIIRRATSFIRR